VEPSIARTQYDTSSIVCVWFKLTGGLFNHWSKMEHEKVGNKMIDAQLWCCSKNKSMDIHLKGVIEQVVHNEFSDYDKPNRRWCRWKHVHLCIWWFWFGSCLHLPTNLQKSLHIKLKFGSNSTFQSSTANLLFHLFLHNPKKFVHAHSTVLYLFSR
jgi:hypothetical protein